MRDPFLQRRLVKESYRTQAKYSHSVQLGAELVNVSLSKSSHKAGDYDQRSITGSAASQSGG